jgi:hypothetical protein
MIKFKLTRREHYNFEKLVISWHDYPNFIDLF